MSELRDQHKAFAEWFLQQNPIAPNAEDMAWAAWKAALAQPESEAHPPRDEWRLASEVPEDAMFSRGAVAAIVAGAIYDFAGFMTTRPVSVSIGASEACGPVVDLITSFAEKRGLDLEEAAVQSWNLCIGRDVQPPTEATIAAKCQRIESDGEICGLTPPCPDCGPSLIDVPEGA